MKSIEKQLQDVFNHPTAPYREGWVLNYIKSELERLKVPYFQDRWKNIIAGVDFPRSLKKSRRLALIAHTDHPGFHIIKKLKSNTYLAQWHGGHPPKIKNSKAAIYHPMHPGKISKAVFATNIEKKCCFRLKVTKHKFEIDEHCFGAFDFAGFKKNKSKIYTRVADDLAGVTIILAVLERLPKKLRSGFLGIFTTAEETGFKGALGLLYDELLGKQNTAISLEASKQMPGAILGCGPVIRLGDKKTLFNQNVIGLIDQAANELKKIKYQRRIMSGGTCEATPFNLCGIACGGMAVPLGNYHNQKTNGKPGPEMIDLNDVKNAVDILIRVYKNKAINKIPSVLYSKKLKKEFNKAKKYFNQKVEYEY